MPADESAPARLRGSKILIGWRGEPHTPRSLASHEYAFDNINEQTGEGTVVPRGGAAKAGKDTAPVLGATGLYFEGKHQPNGTLTAVGSNGAEVTYCGRTSVRQEDKGPRLS